MAQSRVSVPSYIKNVAKSFGYAFEDTFKSYNPVISSLVKETKDTTAEMYQSIKSFKSDSGAKSFDAKGTVSDVFNNFKDDLKTGNWYNKQRQQAADNDMIKALGFDMSDFDLDLEDWGDDDTLEATKAEIASGENNTKQIIGAMDVIGYQIAGSVSEATVESANYIVESSRQSTKALYGLNQKGFTQVTQALMTLNNSVVSFAKIGEPLSAHMQNATVFYTKATETLNRMDQTLQQIAKNTTPAPSALDFKYKSAKGTLSSVLSDGTISINMYKEMVKESFGDSKDMISMAMGAIKGFKGEGGSYGKNISIATMATKMISGVLLPKVFKESMKNLNESIKYALSGGIVKLRNSTSSNLVVEILKDIFLPKDGFKSSINVANYEKGTVSWDGISRKALTEVIPTTLLKIYSVLSGEPEMRYDYKSGKFVTVGSIRKAVQDEEARAARNAGGKFREDALESIKNKGLTPEQQAQMEKEIEAYFSKAFKKGSGFYDINKSNFNADEFGLTEESLKVLQNLLKEYKKSGDSEKRNRGNRFVSDVAIARDEYGDEMRRQEATGTSMRVHLQNGSISNNTDRFGVDKYNHSISFYLQGIYQYTGYLADNIDYISGRSRKVKKRRKIQKGEQYEEIANVSTISVGERTTDQANSNIQINDSLDEDEQQDREREENYRNLGEEADKKAKSIKDRLKEVLGKFSPKSIKRAYDRPFEAAANLLNSIGFSLDKLLWGKDGSEDSEQGIFGYIITHTKNALNKFNNFIDEQFGVNMKKKITDFWDMLWGEKDENGKRQGGKFKDFREQTVENLKGAGNWAKNAAKDLIFGKRIKPSNGGGETEPIDQGQAAYGRRVTKSGIVAVSEGELIIPSELNPFYHGTTNKREQIRTERNAINKFYGSFAEGGTAGEESPPPKEEREGGLSKLFFDGLKSLFSGITEFASQATSKDDKDAKKDKSIISEISKKMLSEAGENKGAIGAGALIGGGVSLLTGAVVGPLFGAAIGGAVGLAIKSKTVQKILFGETNEDGELDGGLLNKNISNFIMKSVPSMAKGGALGTVGGLFLGSPILGAVLGSTVGYISSSDKAKEALFGKQEENGQWKEGIIPKSLQDQIKKSGTKMAAGAILGTAIGPFGIMGNIIVGAGLGYLSETKNFHEYLFGKEGDENDKGLAGIFKDKIFKNLDNIFHNLGNAISGWGKNLIKGTTERLKDFFTKRARAFENGEQQGFFGKLVGGAVSLTGKAVKGATNFVGNRLEGINNRLVRGNLRNGYNVYDRELGRNMTAAERVAARGGSEGIGSRDTFGNFDQLLANGSREELEQLRTQLESAKDPNRVYKRSMNTAMNSLYSGMSDLDPKKAEKVAKLIKQGKMDKISSVLSPEEMEKYKDVINSASENVSKAKNSKSNSREILNKFSEQGMNFRSAGDINSALDRLNDELKNPELSEEAEEKKEEKDWRHRVLKIFESMDINLARFTGGNSVDGETQETDNESKNESENNRTGIQEALANLNVEGKAEERTEIDAFGNVHQFTRNSQGEWEEVTNDSDTDESRSKINRFMDSINKIPLIGTAIGGLTSLFGSFKDKLLGDGEEKEGLFSKLLSFLNGEDGPLSWLTSIISGTSIGKLTKNMLSKVTLKSIGTNLIGPVLLAAGLTGSFDKIAEEITNGAYGKGSDADIYEDKNSGKQIHKDENGNWVDEDGNIVENPDISVRKGSVDSFSDKLKYNAVRGVATNTKSVTSVVLSKTSVGKKVSSGITSIAQSIGADDVAKAARSNLQDTILDACVKFTSALRKVPALSGIADKLDDMGLALAEKAGKALASESAENIAKLASNAVLWAKIAFVVIDFTSGYEDARTTLGIIDEPSFGQKVISGLLRAVKNFIPVIGSLLPDSLIIDVFCDYVAPALGIDVEELKAQRQKAQETVDSYNEAQGTNYSVGEFNKAVLKDYTWTERVGNATKSTIADTKDKFSNMKKGIKEKGLGGYMVDSVKDMGSNFINSYKENGGGVSGVFNAIGSTFKNLLPGVLGEIAQKNMDIKALAVKGELGEMWKVSLNDFSGGGEKVEGTDLETAVPGIFSKIIGQIPLIVSKVTMTPLALVSGIFHKVKGFIDDKGGVGGIIGNIAGGLDNFFGVSDIIELMKQGDVKGVISYSPASDDENTFMKVVKALPSTIVKITATPISAIIGVGKKIGEFIGNIVSKVKNGFTYLKEQQDYGAALFRDGDSELEDIFKIDDPDPENPMGGFMKAVTIITRLTGVPKVMIQVIGKKFVDGFKNVANKVKTTFTTLGSNTVAMEKNVRKGDFSGVWNYDLEEDPENPVGGFTKGIFRIIQILSMPKTALFWAGRKVVDGFKNVANKVKTTFTTLGSNYATMQQSVKAGDFSGVWNYDLQEDPENPVGGFTKGIFRIMQILSMPKTAMHWAGNKIRDGFNAVVDKVKTTFTTLYDGYNSISATAKSGDVKGVWDIELTDDSDNPVGGFTKGIFRIMQIINTPSAAIHWVGNKIKDGISSLVEKTSSNYETMTTSADALKELAKEGNISGIWGSSLDLEDGDPLKGIWHVTFTVNKLFQTIVAAVYKLIGPVKEAIEFVSDGVSGLVDGVVDVAGSVGSGIKDGVKSVGKGIKKGASALWNGAQDLFGFGSGLPSGGGSSAKGFVSQLDPKYKDMKFGNSTVAQKGCAPAVATMVANQYGKKLTMSKAVSETSGYHTSDGTSVDYFSKVLNKQGIGTEYLNGPDVSNKVMQNLVNGQSVILLGKDTNNVTKDKSPFGPNGHYVVATGLDKNGNLIINDPEAKGPRIYDKSILKNTTIGVGTVPSGGSTYDTEIAQQVWGFFTKNGYSPEATAGIMGNIYQESGMHPDLLQNGVGPAAGLFQWEKYGSDGTRWGNMNKYAQNQGKSWTDLNSQLNYALSEIEGSDINARFKNNQGNGNAFRTENITEDGVTYNTTEALPGGTEDFKKLTDPQKATILFEAAFERAGIPKFARRLEATKAYYDLYSGSTYTGNYDGIVGSSASGTNGTTSADSSSTGVTDIISAIGTAFTGALGNVFSTGDSSSESATADYSSSGTPIVLGDVPQGKGNSAQKEIVRYAESILNRDNYSQDANLRTKVGQGYSDCSSFAQWCYKNAIGIDPGGYTGSQIESPLLTPVDNGTRPNKENLEAGDLMFYKANENNGRKYNVGHVEIYDGNGNTIGHGSGQGPIKQDLDYYVTRRENYGGPYIMSMRYKDIANASGGSSGLLLNARPGSYLYSGAGSGLSTPKYTGRYFRSFSGGASDIASKTTDMLNNTKNVVIQQANNGTISADLVQKLIQAIIDILEKIANNTAPVGQIYQALISNQISANATAKVAEKISESSNNDDSTEIDSNIRNLVGTLAALAKG